jgi:hypothetical protein
MATVNSVGYNLVNATPPVNQPPQDGGGRVRIYRDTYTQGAADGSIGDIIQCKNLPAGARVLPGGMLCWGTGNTSETLKAGVTGSDAAFIAATAAATAGKVALDAFITAGEAIYDVGTSPVAVLITNGVAAIKAAQKITITLPYVID